MIDTEHVNRGIHETKGRASVGRLVPFRVFDMPKQEHSSTSGKPGRTLKS